MKQSNAETITVGDIVFPIVSHVPKVRLQPKQLAQVFGLELRDDGAIGWTLDDNSWVFATIENAAQWTHHDGSSNRNNRPVSPSHALSLARAMSNGEYYRDAYLNLIFANGFVCNCQHTMVAAIHVLNTRFPDFPKSEKAEYQGVGCPADIDEDGIDVILVADLDEILVDILDTARPRTPKDALIRRHLLSSAKPADNAAMASAIRLLVVRYFHQKPTLSAKIKVGTATTLKAMNEDSRFAPLVDVVQSLVAANIQRTYDDDTSTWKDVKSTSGYFTRKTTKSGDVEKKGFGLNLAYLAYVGTILVNGEKCTAQQFAEWLNDVAFSESENVPASLLELRTYLLKFGGQKTTTEVERWDAVRAIILAANDFFSGECDENFRLSQLLPETAFLNLEGGQKARNLYLQGGSDVLNDVSDEEIE